jgi:hypothetical protein
MAKNDLVKKEEVGVPAMLDLEADAGVGFEGADAQSYAIPFLRILQSGSPQVKKSEAEYIKGAEEGDFYNTITGEVIKGEDGVVVVPCAYKRSFLLWAPNRGGYKGELGVAEGELALQSATRNDKNKMVGADGNIIDDTRSHYCLLLSGGGVMPVLISMSSTQIKKSKKWMSMMQNIKLKNGQVAPMFSQQFKLTTVPESNDDGSWFGWKIEHSGQVSTVSVYEAAKQFHEMVRSGTVSATPAADDGNF